MIVINSLSIDLSVRRDMKTSYLIFNTILSTTLLASGATSSQLQNSPSETSSKANINSGFSIEASTAENQEGHTIEPTQLITVDVSCPRGWFAAGGGHSIDPPTTKNLSVLTSTVRELYKPQSPNAQMGYRVRVKNDHTQAQQISILSRATCLNPR